MLRQVTTQYGAVRGLPAADPRITSFKGIPFAAPPVGENRWRAPQPPKAWEGTLNAYEYAPISVQNTPGLGDGLYDREWHVDPRQPMSEDCLYLNIWTPAKRADEKLPVLVWIFGGGLQWGYPSEMEFDGERLARRGIVVVTVNYRLNVFGFLAHPEITAESPDSPSNFGNLDQQAGLKWTYENISAFGGDPENITIAGQSAGGGSVLSQLACADNRPYIRRAIIMSAMINSPYGGDHFGAPRPLRDAEADGKRFFETLGVSSLEEARRIDADTVLRKYDEYVSQNGRMFFVLDGRFTTGDPMAMLMENRSLDVPVMVGSTADEFPSFLAADSEESLERAAEKAFGPEKDVFLSFPEARAADAPGQYARVNGIELTCRAVLEGRKAHGAMSDGWYYRFGPEIPGWDRAGSFHSCDLWFFFETLAKCWRPFRGEHYDLARQMCGYWAHFIKTGDPNGDDHDGTPLPQWRPYSADGRDAMLFLQKGATNAKLERSAFEDFLQERVRLTLAGEGKQAFNPYLPSWEYVPDGEPYVFGDRVYVYGSHDLYNGDVFCIGDYVCWSAPVTDLSAWRYDGVIYRRDADPANRDLSSCLYAPDVTVGPDGRYYLYYVLSGRGCVSVAVCDTPNGAFQFYGYVRDKNGGIIGERPGDEAQFDPGVLTEGEKTYLYTGFCPRGDRSRHGAMGMRLAPDMITAETEPVIVVPGCEYGAGTDFEGHEYFEAASIRKVDGKYVFVYSSVAMHELCYAVSDTPLSGFRYGGVIVSNCDMGVDTYKPAGKNMAYGANNHGSIVEIGGKWYVFYHRHTNGTWYSRQGCAERISVLPGVRIPQAEITSCGLNGAPLRGRGAYPAYIACNMTDEGDGNGFAIFTDPQRVKVAQDGSDGERTPAYIANFKNGATVGFKYFDIKNLRAVKVTLRGYASGTVEIRTKWDGEIVGSVSVHYANIWETYTADVTVPDGVHALYFTYRGTGAPSFLRFELV